MPRDEPVSPFEDSGDNRPIGGSERPARDSSEQARADFPMAREQSPGATPARMSPVGPTARLRSPDMQDREIARVLSALLLGVDGVQVIPGGSGFKISGAQLSRAIVALAARVTVLEYQLANASASASAEGSLNCDDSPPSISVSASVTLTFPMP